MSKYKFNVIYYDINKDKMTEYDIIPYLMLVYNKIEDKPETISGLKSFILSELDAQGCAFFFISTIRSSSFS